jgi:hypothetical protein
MRVPWLQTLTLLLQAARVPAAPDEDAAPRRAVNDNRTPGERGSPEGGSGTSGLDEG